MNIASRLTRHFLVPRVLLSISLLAFSLPAGAQSIVTIVDDGGNPLPTPTPSPTPLVDDGSGALPTPGPDPWPTPGPETLPRPSGATVRTGSATGDSPWSAVDAWDNGLPASTTPAFILSQAVTLSGNASAGSLMLGNALGIQTPVRGQLNVQGGNLAVSDDLTVAPAASFETGFFLPSINTYDPRPPFKVARPLFWEGGRVSVGAQQSMTTNPIISGVLTASDSTITVGGALTVATHSGIGQTGFTRSALTVGSLRIGTASTLGLGDLENFGTGMGSRPSVGTVTMDASTLAASEIQVGDYGYGSLTLNGTTATVTGNVKVGAAAVPSGIPYTSNAAGSGILTLTNGSSLTSNVFSLARGQLYLSDSRIDAQSAYVGLDAHSGYAIAVAQIGPGGVLETTGNLTLGWSEGRAPGRIAPPFTEGHTENADGYIDITGGSVIVHGGTVLGVDGGSGTVTVKSGRFTTDGDLTIGRGPQALGRLLVEGGSVAVGGDLLLGIGAERYIGDHFNQPDTGFQNNNYAVLRGNEEVTGRFRIGVGEAYLQAGTLHAKSEISMEGGAFSLVGGTLLADAPIHIGGNRFVLNRGTLRAGSDQPNFLEGGTVNLDAVNFFGAGIYTDNYSMNGFVQGTNYDIYRDPGNPVIDSNGHDIGISATLAGPGGFTKSGAGTLTLSAANTFSGPVSVSGGGIRLTSPLALQNATLPAEYEDSQVSFGVLSAATIGGFSGSGAFDLGRVALTLGGSDSSSTFAGTLYGTGALTKVGTGIFTVTGVNTYTGGTLIRQGLVNFTNGGNLGSGNITLDGGGLQWAAGATADPSARLNPLGAAGATFDVQGNDVALASPISGAGGLWKSGNGTLTLTGAAYAGTTTISAGTLRIGNTGFLPGNIVNQASFVLQRSGSTTLAGSLANAGAITFSGSGGAILSGNITNSGTMAFIDSGSTTFTGNVANAGTITFAGSGSVSFSGALSGSGPITVSGATVTLSQVNSFTGTIRLQAGILNLLDTPRGDLELSAGVTLHVGSAASLTGASGGDATFQQSARDGATPVLFGADSHFINEGQITGGFGGNSNVGLGPGNGGKWNSGNGAPAASFGPNATISNFGVIVGGDGGAVNYPWPEVYRGAAGIALLLGDSAYLDNSGTIAGGTAGGTYIGRNFDPGSPGGVAISGANLTVINRGSIVGGLNSIETANADAIVMAGSSNTLELQAGSVIVGNVNALGDADTLILGGSADATFDISTFGDAVQYRGFESFLKTGTGTWTLTGASATADPPSILEGTLLFANRTAFANGNAANWTAEKLSIAGGATAAFALGGAGQFAAADIDQIKVLGTDTGGFQSGSSLGLSVDSASTYASDIGDPNGGANALGLAKLGVGTLTLTGANTYSGGTTVRAGTLAVAGLENLGSGAVSILTGGRLTTAGDTIFNRVVTVSDAGSTLTPGGYLEFGHGGAGSLTVGNGGRVASPSTLAFGVAGNGSGSVTGDGSTLEAASTLYVGAFGGTGTLSVGLGGIVTAPALQLGLGSGRGTFTLNVGGTLRTSAIVNNGSSVFNLRGGTLQVVGTNLATDTPLALRGLSTIDTNGFDAALAGNLSGLGSLLKIGAGSLTLSGQNSYIGSTTLMAGTLIAGSDHAFGVGSVVIKGGTFQVQSGVTISNPIYLAGGTLGRGLATGAVLADLGNFQGAVPGGIGTTASLLGGATSAPASVNSSFAAISTAGNDSHRLSDVFTISGVPVVDSSTGATDIFVLQLAIPHVTANSILGWFNPASSQWVNAVDGNFGGTSFFSGDHAYDAATNFNLGTYGVNTLDGTVWAVLNHNSEFAIVDLVAVPEPAIFSGGIAALLAGITLLRRRRFSDRQGPGHPVA